VVYVPGVPVSVVKVVENKAVCRRLGVPAAMRIRPASTSNHPSELDRALGLYRNSIFQAGDGDILLLGTA